MKVKMLGLLLCPVLLVGTAFAKPSPHLAKIISYRRVITHNSNYCNWVTPCEEVEVVLQDDAYRYTLIKSPVKKSEDFSWLHNGDEITVRITKHFVYIQHGDKWVTIGIAEQEASRLPATE